MRNLIRSIASTFTRRPTSIAVTPAREEYAMQLVNIDGGMGLGIGTGLGTATAIAPTLINAYSVLTIPAYWRAITFLASNLASFPRGVYRDGAKPEGNRHPLERILKRRPNAYQNSTAFWRALFFAAAHRGNGYARIERTGTFRVEALHNLPTDEVSPFRYEGEQYYLHRPPGKTGKVYHGSDIIHLQSIGHDGQVGIDPVTLHNATFQQAATLVRYQTVYLQRGTVLRGAIQIPTGVSREQVTEIQAILRDYFRGVEAERDVIVLSDGAQLNNATVSPQQSQIVEQGAAITKTIAQVTGVPPQFLYEFAESKYNNSIEQMGQDVVRYTFRPWIEQIEEELTLKLLTESEQERGGLSIVINPDALLRGDTASVNKSAIETVKAGLRTRNEGRVLLNLPPDEDPSSNKLSALGETTQSKSGAAQSEPSNET